ncbi:MAG: TlpA family protein disulfide reductase [Bryobacterales bacterium]|jgi:cytochrome c biogenesis protein CcmG/thiol:disulfide interchange protein DsbE|nr:TlpA family protein disulfide reductase [Bryobacterales bacterium]
MQPLSRRALLASLGLSASVPLSALETPKAPAFEVRTELGKRIRLEDYSGKVLLLTFWATWCPHCRNQIAAMEKLRETYAAKEIEMLAVSVDREGWKIVAPYVQEHGLRIPVSIAPPRMQQQYAANGGIPLSYIIDRKGQMIKDFRGALDEETLRRLGDAIQKAL